MERPKTIFCDIDGTLWNHVGGVPDQATVKGHVLLPNTKDAIDKWDRLGYRIILTTGRKESAREATVKQMQRAGINYDQLIMGFGGGDRVLLNDRKPHEPTRDTAYVINLERNKGVEDVEL